MNFSNFIDGLKMDNDFDVEFRISLELTKEAIEDLTYKYPYESYNCQLSINGDTLILAPTVENCEYKSVDIIELLESVQGSFIKVMVDLTTFKPSSINERFGLSNKMYNVDENDVFIDSAFSEKHKLIEFNVIDA